MDKFLKDFDSVISDCNDQINVNIVGLNYLEKLKYLLIEKFRSLELKFETNSNIDNDKQVIKKFDKIHLLTSFQQYQESVLKMKHKLENDILNIVITGFESVNIFNNLKDIGSYTTLSLFPKTGLVLSKETIITTKIPKETIILEISIINQTTDIENL